MRAGSQGHQALPPHRRVRRDVAVLPYHVDEGQRWAWKGVLLAPRAFCGRVPSLSSWLFCWAQHAGRPSFPKGFTPREMIDANVAFTGRGGGLVDRFYERVMFPIFDEQGNALPSVAASRAMASRNTSTRPRPRCSIKSATCMDLTGLRSISSPRVRPWWLKAIRTVSHVGRLGLATWWQRWERR